MRYKPYEEESAAVPHMTDEDLLEYFLYRIAETDEVWGLKEGPQWITREIDGHETQPVWPLRYYADASSVGEWENMIPIAESLEFFTYQILTRLTTRKVLIEIMPRLSGPGCLISPQRLFGLLENMRESGEFVLDD